MVNLQVPKLVFAGCMCLEGVCKTLSLLGSQTKPSPLKLSVKFKCQIWPEITKKVAKECLDASSLRLSRKINA